VGREQSVSPHLHKGSDPAVSIEFWVLLSMELCWGRWCIRCFYNPRSCIRPALFRFKENGTGSHVVDAISSIRANSRTNSILKVDFHNILYI
jgi:hypothetical protein